MTPEVRDIITTFASEGRTPQETAQALSLYREDAYNSIKQEAGPATRDAWAATDALDADIEEGLGALRTSAIRSYVDEKIPEGVDQDDFWSRIKYDMPWDENLGVKEQDFTAITNDPAFKLPPPSAPANVDAGENRLFSYQFRPRTDGTFDALVTAPEKEDMVMTFTDPDQEQIAGMTQRYQKEADDLWAQVEAINAREGETEPSGQEESQKREMMQDARMAMAKVAALSGPQAKEFARNEVLVERMKQDDMIDYVGGRGVGDYAKDLTVGLSMFGLGWAQSAAMAAGFQEEADGLAKLAQDIQSTSGSYGVEFSGGLLQRSVKGAGVSAGMMAPALALGPAGRAAGLGVGAAETGALASLAPAVYSSAYNETIAEADALEQQGRTEEAQVLRNRAGIKAVADTVFELGVEKINPFFGQVGAKGWAKRLPAQVFQEAIVEEPLTMLAQEAVSNRIVDRPADFSKLPEVVASAAIATGGMQAVGGVVSMMIPEKIAPADSNVTPADVAKNVAAAASGQPVEVIPEAIRPSDAGAIAAAATVNPETLAAVVAMTTNTTPVATPQQPATPQPTPVATTPPEVVMGVEELTEAEALAIDAELGIQPPAPNEQNQTPPVQQEQSSGQDMPQPRQMPVLPVQPQAQAPQAPVADETPQGGVADIQTTPQTANGKRVGDAINPGENILVASEKDESSPDMPTEYTVLEVETIANPKKNEVHARRRDMTPDEIARTQQKIRERNEVAAEMGMPQEAIPEVPVGPTEPSSQPTPETQQPSDVPEADFANTQPEVQAQEGTQERESQGEVGVAPSVSELPQDSQQAFEAHWTKHVGSMAKATKEQVKAMDSEPYAIGSEFGLPKYTGSGPKNKPDRTIYEENGSVHSRFPYKGSVISVMIDRDNGVHFSSDGSLGLSGKGAFATMNAIMPELKKLLDIHSKYKPNSVYSFNANDARKSSLFERYAKRSGFTVTGNTFTLDSEATPQEKTQEQEAIIRSPQYTQEWIQEETAAAQERGVTEGDTVVTMGPNGETIVGTVESRGDETTTIQTASGAVEVPTQGLVSQNPQSLSRKPGLAQALMESDGAAIQLGISQRDVEKGVAALKRQIPGANNLWSGTREEFLAQFSNDSRLQEMVHQLQDGVMSEGFYVPWIRRGFILTDSTVVYEGDVERSKLNGTAPAVESVKRLIRHEVGGHGGWMDLTQKQLQSFLKLAREVIPVSDINQMIGDGYPFQDWATDEDVFMETAGEWFSQRIGRLDKLPETGPMARFVEWLKDVWRWLTGRKTEPDLQAIKDLWRQIRMNQAAIATGRAWYSLPKAPAPQGAIKAVHYSREPMTLSDSVDPEDRDNVFGNGLYAMEPQDEAMWTNMGGWSPGEFRNEVTIKAKNPLILTPESYQELFAEADRQRVERGYARTVLDYTILERMKAGGHDAIIIRGFDQDQTQSLQEMVEAKINSEFTPKFEPGKTEGRFVNGAERDAIGERVSQKVAGMPYRALFYMSEMQNQIFVPPQNTPSVVSVNGLRYSRVRSNTEIASAIRQQATLPNDPQTASEGMVVRQDVAARFDVADRPGIMLSGPHTLMSVEPTMEQAKAIVDGILQPERDPSKLAESTPEEIEARGGDVELNLIAHEEAVRNAITLGNSVSTSALSRYGISLPPGYLKFGELSAQAAPSIIRATEFLTNPSLAEDAGIGMTTPLYQAVSLELQERIANAITVARNDIERVTLGAAMNRAYRAYDQVGTNWGQLGAIRGHAARIKAIHSGAVLAMVEAANQELQSSIDAALPVEDLVSEINRLKAIIEKMAAEQAGNQITAETEIEAAEVDMNRQEQIAEGIIEEIANRLGDPPVPNEQQRQRQESIRDLHYRNVRQGMTQEQFIQEAAAFDVYEELADRLWKVGNLEREARATIKGAIKDIRLNELAQDRASQLIYGVEERLRQGSKDLTEGPAKDTINKAFRDQVSTPVSFGQFQARLRNLRVNDRNIERLFRTAERERIDLGTQEMMRTRGDILGEEGPNLKPVRARIEKVVPNGFEWRSLIQTGFVGEQIDAKEIKARVLASPVLTSLTPPQVDSLSADLSQYLSEARRSGTSLSPHLNAIIRRIKDRIAPGISWRDLMVVDAQDGQQRVREIYRRVRGHDALRNLSPQEAIQLTNALNRHFLKEKEAVLKKELQKVVQPGGAMNPRVANLFENIRQRKLNTQQVEAEMQSIATPARWRKLRKELPAVLDALQKGRMTIEELAKKLGKARPLTDKAMQHVIDSTPKLIQAMNLGVFNAQAFRDAVSEKFGLRVITAQEAREVQQMAARMTQLPEGQPRREMAAEIIKRIQGVTKLTKAELTLNFWVGAVLSGFGTLLSTTATVLKAFKQVLQAAAWVSIGQYNRGGPRISMNALNRMVRVVPNLLLDGAYSIFTGDTTMFLSEARETDAFFNNGRLTQSMSAAKMEAAFARAFEALRQGNILHGLVIFPAGVSIAVRRLMGAADYITSAAAREGITPLAMALNETLYDRSRIPDADDYKVIRERARQTLTGGRKPATFKERAAENAFTYDLLEQSIESLAIRDQIHDFSTQVSYQNDPTGVPGIAYHNVLNGFSQMTASAKRLTEEPIEDDSPAALKAANKAARNVAYFIAANGRALTGLQFIRFAGNKTNELINYIPAVGMLRLLEEKNRTPLGKVSIISDNVLGTGILLFGYAAVMGMFGEDDDDERRGWRIEGGHNNMTEDQRKQLLTSGRPPYSIGILDRDTGTWRNYFYKEWPTSGAFAAIGNLRDRKQYTPDLWQKDNWLDLIATASVGTMWAALDQSALSNIQDLFGRSSTVVRQPAEAAGSWLTKFGSNYAGGFIPRALKDVDYMMDPKYRKAEPGIDYLLQHVPFYRRTVGVPYENALLEQVEIQSPLTRRFFIDSQRGAYVDALSGLNANGLFVPDFDIGQRVVRRGDNVRPLTDNERGRALTFYRRELHSYLTRESPRLERMPFAEAKEKLGNDIKALKAEAMERAVR